MAPELSAVHLGRRVANLGKGKAKIIFAFLSPTCYFRLRRFQQMLYVLPSARAVSCPERARLEEEFRAARDRMRNHLVGLRKLTRAEERRLADEVAMTIARLKEHAAEHGCEQRIGTAYSSG